MSLATTRLAVPPAERGSVDTSTSGMHCLSASSHTRQGTEAGWCVSACLGWGEGCGMGRHSSRSPTGRLTAWHCQGRREDSWGGLHSEDEGAFWGIQEGGDIFSAPTCGDTGRLAPGRQESHYQTGQAPVQTHGQRGERGGVPHLPEVGDPPELGKMQTSSSTGSQGSQRQWWMGTGRMMEQIRALLLLPSSYTRETFKHNLLLELTCHSNLSTTK